MNNNGILLALVIWPMIGALISYLIGRRNKAARSYFADFVTILEFVCIVWLFIKVAGGSEFSWKAADICGMDIYLKMDGFRAVYSGIAILMWMMTTIFSKEYLQSYQNRNRYYFFTLITFGATVGVFLSGDLFTTYIFFEIMSLSSYVMVAHDESPAALRNAATYLCVGVLGGMVMLMGLFLLYHGVGTLNMDELMDACAASHNSGWMWAAAICLLFGFGAKAGAFPLHFWLPKTHPVAPAPASALLSGILTKAGIYGILITGAYIMNGDTRWGMVILVIGVITMVLGAVLAVFSVDLKRTLACSSLSQIGFILTGAGMMNLLGSENALACRGLFLHMVNHSLIKLDLFMCAGVVVMNIHKLNLNDIRGFGRHKPMLNFIFLMGALGIAGVPFWNGYISKTLLHESIVEYMNIHGVTAGFKTAEWLFLISGGLTLAYMLKLYVCLFIEKNPYNQEKMEESTHHYMNAQSAFALLCSALVLPVLGLFPYRTMNRLADMASPFLYSGKLEENIRYFSWTCVKGACVSLAIGAAVYFAVIRTALMKTDENGNRIYISAWPEWLDLENLIYRPLILVILPAIGTFFSRICDKLTDTILYVLKKTIFRPARLEQRYKIFAFQRFYSKESSVQKSVVESFSFGLTLFAVGLVAVLFYMVFV